MLVRRLPWLMPLLVGCGDDTGGDGGTSSTTGGGTGGTMSTSLATMSTSVGEESSTSTTSVDTTADGGTTESTGTTGSTMVTVAVDDTYFATQDEVFDVAGQYGIFANDTDGGSPTLAAVDMVSSVGGTVMVGADGGFSYTPVAGFWGTDSFGYTIEDDLGEMSSATVTVHVAPVRIPLGDVTGGMGGFVLYGEANDDYSGYSVSGAGDVNGDGLDDLLVGAPDADANGSESGRSYVVFGKVDTAPVQLSAVAMGMGGFVLYGEADGDRSGRSVSGAGDVNGDGLDDLVVGAYRAPNGTLEGRSYVVFGKADTAPVQLSAVAMGMGGFVLYGEAAGDRSGFSVSGAGDVNGDGMDDLVVGAHGAPDGNDWGRSYVVFGKADTAPVQLGAVAMGMGGFVLDGEAAGDYSGYSVSGAGDVNGDGLDDLVVGAYGADPNGSNSGRSYVVFGKADTAPVQLSAVAMGMGGFVLDGETPADVSGWSVSGAGDVNGDGMDDLVVGAPVASFNGLVASGRSYVVFGKADTAPVQLSDIAPDQAGFVLDGEAAFDRSGRSVSGAGDVNGDGMDDLIVGAHYASLNRVDDYSGRSYVVFGKADTAAVQLSAVAMGMGGFVLDGEAALDRSGRSVSGAGDVNGDGLDDVLVGASDAAPNGLTGAGRSYVVFGVITTNTCCNPHPSPGCVDAVIEQCVCDIDAPCCINEWDPVCVEGAISNCGSACIR